MNKKLYFAYGSNLNIRQMAIRCRQAKPIGNGELKDYKLVFCGDGSGVATIEPCKGSTVPIGIWNITENDEKNLDRYEGYPSLYGKKKIEIKIDGKPQKVMTYVMQDGFMQAKPSKSYENTIREGYEDFNLDISKFNEMLEKNNSDIREIDIEMNRVRRGIDLEI